METKQPFQVEGTTVYQLEFDSYYHGEAQMRNRVYAGVYGYRDTPKEELEATARLFAAAPDLLKALEKLLGMVEMEYMPENEKIVAAYKAIAKAQGETE